uniref:Uncharacterized protein n=1 Tax=Fagus sylvatica TaxID=28930 RepID=A0A2N9E7C8_FAGSY
MPIQRRTINIGSVLGTLAPEPSETSNVPLASGFSEGESVMKKRKKGEEEAEVIKEQQALIQTEPSVTKSSSKKGKGKDSRAPQKATGHVSHKRKHQKELPAPWKCEFYVDDRPVNEDDSDMKAWKGNNSTQMIENLKRDSVVAVQGIFEAGYRLVETERLLNESLVENDRLREVEKTVSARIREVESQHKTAEEGLQTAECQLVEISAKLERECERSSGFQAEIDKLRAELAEARLASSNAENAAQAFYDQGFEEAAGSLRLQLRRECNIYFLKGWVSALEQAAVDNSSDLYVLGRDYRPFDSGTLENLEETNVEVLEDCEATDDPTALETAEVLGHQEQVQTEEVQDVEKDKEFTAKRVELVERKTVEHLLKRPCFIDSSGRPRAASVLLDYEEIIEAVPLTAKKGVQVPRLVTPLSNPEFVPSLESSEVGHPTIRFPYVFDPDLNPTEEMPIQKQSINISSVLGTSASETSGTSSLAPPPGFSQGEDVMRRKRKRGEGHKHQNDPKQPWSCPFLLENRAVDEGDSVLKSGKDVRGGQVAEVVGKALLLPEDMKVWQEKRSKHMLENLKRDSILAVQGIFEVGDRLLETERRLNQSQEEIKRLMDFEKSASAKIRAAESAQKSAEAGLLNLENQAEEDAQSYYDQGFNEAADSLQSQLKGECNKYFTQGWHKALDMAGVDDASELYDLARRHQPFGGHVPEERNEEAGRKPLRTRRSLGPMKFLNETILADDPEVLEDQADNQI